MTRRIELVSPLLPTTRAAAAATRPPTLAGIRIGLLANGKPNSDRIVAAVGKLLADERGAILGPLAVKPHISLPVASDVADTFAAEVSVVISAVGD